MAQKERIAQPLNILAFIAHWPTEAVATNLPLFGRTNSDINAANSSYSLAFCPLQAEMSSQMKEQLFRSSTGKLVCQFLISGRRGANHHLIGGARAVTDPPSSGLYTNNQTTKQLHKQQHGREGQQPPGGNPSRMRLGPGGPHI